MTDIQRFKITYLTFDRADVIREHETGDYVLYTDHIAALEAVKATIGLVIKYDDLLRHWEGEEQVLLEGDSAPDFRIDHIDAGHLLGWLGY